MSGAEQPSAVVRRRVVVHGSVHGVGFRVSCARRAEALGLGGWVRNCSDGTVEAVFEGGEEAVTAIVEWCRRGPPAAEVTDVEVFEEVPQWQQGFSVT